MASIPGVEDSFEMGRVVSRAFGTIGRNIRLILGLTILIVAVPSLLLRPFTPDPATLATAPSGGSWLALGLVSLIGFFTNYILVAALTYAMVTDMNGDKPVFGKALRVGLRYMLPLLLLGIVSMAGIYFGLLFLVIPGLIIGVMWSVAAPAMVTENLGVFASLGRSRALTKGSRWRIFLLLLVAGILTVLPLLLVAFSAGTAASILEQPLGAMAIVMSIINSLAIMILIAIDAAIYVELRAVKEGASTESLASIFA